MNFQNLQWEDRFDVPSFYRDVFNAILEELDHKLILTLIGTRRVGKTILLKQVINHLITERNVNPKQILFFSLDLYSVPLFEIFEVYTQELHPESKEMKYLFFDEIQFLDNWAAHAKMIYDNRSMVKIFLSGSSASDLFRGRESLAGREMEIIVPPLSFSEYLRISQKNPINSRIKWDYYMDYMDHQLPDLVLMKISEREYIGQIVDKIINNDFRRLHNIVDTRPIDTIFRIICKSPGAVIVLVDLAQELDLDWRTIQHYLTILEKAMLIRKVYNYSRNPRKSEKRSKRYYPYYTSLHLYTSPYKLELGKKAETEVAFQTNAEYFWNDRNKEIDFIVGDELEIGIEVKMRNTISRRDVKWLMLSDLVEKKIVIKKFDSQVRRSGMDEMIMFVDLSDVGEIESRSSE